MLSLFWRTADAARMRHVVAELALSRRSRTRTIKIALFYLISLCCLCPTNAAQFELRTQSFAANDGGYWRHTSSNVWTRESSGTASRAFQLNLNVPKFDTSLGALQQVNLRWHGGRIGTFGGFREPGEVDLGVYPNGPHFTGGSGTVSGSATLSLWMDLATSTAVFDTASASGIHTGSIGGRPGVNSSDTIPLIIGFTGQQSFSETQDLLLFEGLGTVRFTSELATEFAVTVSSKGPKFGARASLIPGIGTEVEVTYTYLHKIPEPHSSYLIVGTIAVWLLAGRRNSTPKRPNVVATLRR